MSVVLRVATFLLSNAMRIVEPNQPFAILSMQRERVIQSMRFLRSRRDFGNDEPDPVSAVRIHNQREAIQIEQRVEGRIMLLHSVKRLSYQDNCSKFRINP